MSLGDTLQGDTTHFQFIKKQGSSSDDVKYFYRKNSLKSDIYEE